MKIARIAVLAAGLLAVPALACELPPPGGTPTSEQYACLRQVYSGPADQWPPPHVDPDVAWKELGPLPERAPAPANNPHTEEKARLGEDLFFDPRLSRSGQIACASCHEPDLAFDWAERFDDSVAGQLATDPGAILRTVEHPDYGLAVPTPDHFIPLLYIAGIAAASNQPMEPLVRGYAMGSLSMTCYGVGMEADCREESGAATVPEDVPADQTNI